MRVYVPMIACVVTMTFCSCEKRNAQEAVPAKKIDRLYKSLPQADPLNSEARRPEEVPKLISVLGSPEDQLAAVNSLVRLGSERAVKTLAAFIATLPDGDFKEEVVRQASSITNRDSVTTCLAFIATAQDAGVLRVAQAVFARLVDAESLQTVLNTYDSSTDQVVRDRLAQSVSFISNENAVPVLIQVLSDSRTQGTDGMVMASAQALRQFGTAPAVDALIERINSETSEESRTLLTAEVVHVTNPLAEMSLQNAAGGNSKLATTQEARIAAIGALINYPSAETLEQLKLLQRDTNPQVGLAASEALKSIAIRVAAH